MSSANKAHFESEKEAINMILTGIGDEIYSTIDACKTAHEICEAIERLQQGESLNIQNEVNEIHAERIAKTANPLALVATAQPHQDSYYQTLKSHKSYAPTSKTSLPTKSHATTRHKGKEIAKPITPPSESASEEDSNPEQAQRDKDMQKNLALIAKYFKKIYKPTNNNLRTSSNTRNKNEFGHCAKECMKPKRVKDFAYHKEKMLLCKQAEQELEAHYNYMAKIQEVPTADSCTDSEPLKHVQNDAGYNVFANKIQHSEQPKSISNTCVVETGDSNVILDSLDMCDNDIQNDPNGVECDDERLLAQKDIDIKEGLKVKAYEISVVKEKHDEQIARMNMGQDRQMQMIGGNGGNQFRQYAGQNAGNLNGYNAVQNVGNQVILNVAQNPRVQNVDTVIDCSKGRGGNPTSSRRQASSSGTQTDSTPVYDSDGSAENDNNVISEVTDVKQDGETVEQHSANFKETHALYESLYQNLALHLE
nr:hypothetical protein [Tanacetum cinerariifolium]